MFASARGLVSGVASGRSAARRLAMLVGADPLLGLPGIGILTADRLIVETGDVRRFRSPDAFAALAGLAPIPASSGQIQRVRRHAAGTASSIGPSTRSP